MIKVRKSVEIVVAAYKEDLSWLDQVRHPIIIYNKNDVEPQRNEKIINLHNIGRESHTYLHHIIHNYDCLSDITIFSQGWPFDHYKHFLEIANSNSISMMNTRCAQYEDRVSRSKEYCGIGYEFKTEVPDDWNFKWIMPYAAIALEEVHPGRMPPRNYQMVCGALFAVSKESIRKLSTSKYKYLYDQHYKMSHYGHVMEHIWYHLFN